MGLILLLPITFSFGLAGLPHLLVKLGYTVHQFFLEPTFAVYCVFIGVAISLCFWFRQLMLFILLFIASTVGLVIVYLIYVL